MDFKELNAKTIEDVLNENKLVIIEFYTSWCPSCKMVSMNLEEFEELHSDVFILQINADENKEIVSNYKVVNAPTLLFFKNRELFNRHTGFIDVDEMEEIFNDF